MKGFDGNPNIAPMSTTSKPYLQDARRRRAPPQQKTKLERQAPACLVSRPSPGLRFFFTAISDNESAPRSATRRHRFIGAKILRWTAAIPAQDDDAVMGRIILSRRYGRGRVRSGGPHRATTARPVRWAGNTPSALRIVACMTLRP